MSDQQVQLLEQVVSKLSALVANQQPAAALTIDEAAARLRCKRTKVFKLLRDGKIQRTAERIGKQTTVLASSVEAYLTKVQAVPVVAPPKTPGRKPGAAATFDLAAEREKLRLRRLKQG